MGYKATTDAEKIRGQYGLALGEIMKAGSESVAKIQGEYNNAGLQLQGEYSLAGEKIRGNAARDVAQRNKEASMFGSFPWWLLELRFSFSSIIKSSNLINTHGTI